MSSPQPNGQNSPTSTLSLPPKQLEEMILLLRAIHDQPSLPPTEGELVVKWFESFLPATIGVATLGSSITFTTIVSQLQDPARLNPADPTALTPTLFERETVRMFLGISWLLFVIALGIASFAILMLNFHREEVKMGFNPKQQKLEFKIAGLVISFVLEGLLFGAFLVLSLALVAYSQVVGWIAVGCTTAFALAGLILWVLKIFSSKH